MVVLVVGIFLTLLDLIISFLGSMGSIGIIGKSDIDSPSRIVTIVLLLVINIVLPLISVLVLKSLLKNFSQNNSEMWENEEIIKKLVRKIMNVILYPTVILLDIYTTFLGVGQLFILDELRHTRLERIYTDLDTILLYTSFENRIFIIGISIVLFIGHLMLAGDSSKTKETINDNN